MLVRTCVVCRKEVVKDQALRFVLCEAELRVDLLGKESGRGAYICCTKNCLENPDGLKRLKGVLTLGSKATRGERKKIFKSSERSEGKRENSVSLKGLSAEKFIRQEIASGSSDSSCRIAESKADSKAGRKLSEILMVVGE